MARRREFVRGAVAIRGKRQTTWLQLDPVITIVDSSAVLVGSLNAAALALRPFTVVRTRTTVHIRSDVDAAAENQIAGIGHAVVSDQAVAIGVTAVPTPLTDLGSDLWFAINLMYSSVGTHTGAGSYANRGVMEHFDSRAMRKVEVGQDLITVIEGSTVVNGAAVTCGGRILVKLH